MSAISSLSASSYPNARPVGGSRVDEASRQVQVGQQKVDERQADTDRKASAAAQAAAELAAAQAAVAVARDQAQLAAVKSRATIDVYT